jgi:protein-S-isoprenylcysteine O-methyltransferase Ste14
LTTKKNKDNPGITLPPPLIFIILLVIGLLLRRYYPLQIIPDSKTVLKTIGNILFIIYGLITVPTVIQMIRQKTTFSTHGSTTTLLTTGFFRYSRNPLYVSLLFVLTAIAFYINSLWLLFLLPVLVIALNRFAIIHEENYLEEKFGDDYLQYKEKVRRWI